MAEVGDPRRFATADPFASYGGAAPVERGSGPHARLQINPGGNRRLNWALHIMAIVRIRLDTRHSKPFMATRVQQGKTKRAALRLLKTYLAREIFKALSQSRDLPPPASA